MPVNGGAGGDDSPRTAKTLTPAVMIPEHPPSDNPSDNPLSPLADLGEPFASYGRALLRADDARRREHEAQVAGDHDAAARADLDRLEAIGDVEEIKHAEATRLLMALRWAEELFPGAAQRILDPFYRAELDNTQLAIVEADHRLLDVEDALAEVAAHG